MYRIERKVDANFGQLSLIIDVDNKGVCLSRAVSNYANNNINLPRNSNETPPPILYVELIQRVTPRFTNANVSGGRNKFREIKSKTSN